MRIKLTESTDAKNARLNAESRNHRYYRMWAFVALGFDMDYAIDFVY